MIPRDIAELDEMRARAICDWQEPGKYDSLAEISPFDSTTMHQDHYKAMARAIREADEAAGLALMDSNEIRRVFSGRLNPLLDQAGQATLGFAVDAALLAASPFRKETP